MISSKMFSGAFIALGLLFLGFLSSSQAVSTPSLQYSFDNGLTWSSFLGQTELLGMRVDPRDTSEFALLELLVREDPLAVKDYADASFQLVWESVAGATSMFYLGGWIPGADDGAMCESLLNLGVDPVGGDSVFGSGVDRGPADQVLMSSVLSGTSSVFIPLNGQVRRVCVGLKGHEGLVEADEVDFKFFLRGTAQELIPPPTEPPVVPPTPTEPPVVPPAGPGLADTGLNVFRLFGWAMLAFGLFFIGVWVRDRMRQEPAAVAEVGKD